MNISVPQIIQGVKVKGNLRSTVARDQLVTLLADRIKAAFPSTLAGLRDDLSLVLLLCRCVENSGTARYKFDKKAVVLAVMQKLFPDQINPQMLASVGSQIDCLCENGLVHKIGRLSQFWYFFLCGKKRRQTAKALGFVCKTAFEKILTQLVVDFIVAHLPIDGLPLILLLALL